MAKSYGAIPSSGIMTFDKSFARANGQPLDTTSVYYSLDDAKNYAKTDVAYIGQILTVIENNAVTTYQITNAAGNLQTVMNEENFPAATSAEIEGLFSN